MIGPKCIHSGQTRHVSQCLRTLAPYADRAECLTIADQWDCKVRSRLTGPNPPPPTRAEPQFAPLCQRAPWTIVARGLRDGSCSLHTKHAVLTIVNPNTSNAQETQIAVSGSRISNLQAPCSRQRYQGTQHIRAAECVQAITEGGDGNWIAVGMQLRSGFGYKAGI